MFKLFHTAVNHYDCLLYISHFIAITSADCIGDIHGFLRSQLCPCWTSQGRVLLPKPFPGCWLEPPALLNPQMFCHQAGRRFMFWGITITVCGPDCQLCFHRTENPVAVVLNNSKSRQPPVMEGEVFSLHEERRRGRGAQQQSEWNWEAESFNKQTAPSFPRGYVA